MQRAYKKLRRLALDAGLTMPEACRALGIPARTVADWKHEQPEQLTRYFRLLDFLKAKAAEVKANESRSKGGYTEQDEQLFTGA